MQGAALCEAIIPYWDGKSKPMSYQLQSMVPEGGQQTITSQHKRCKMYDMRALRSTSLDVQGFLLVDHATTLARGDFLDAASLTGPYYAEMEQLIRAHVPGVERVVVFDHNVRTAGENLFDDAAREEQRYRDEAAERVVPIGPVIGAHNGKAPAPASGVRFTAACPLPLSPPLPCPRWQTTRTAAAPSG